MTSIGTDQDPPRADVLYRARLIRTMDPGTPAATGMLVRGDRVLAIDAFERLAAAVPAGTAMIDLRPLTLLPGFIDAHCHITSIAYLVTGVDCSPSAVGGIREMQEALSGAQERGDGWVTGSGYVDHRLAERRHPTRDDLDEAVPDRPCVVYHASLHACVVNSAGLRTLGITEGAADPANGRLGRRPDGRLNGLLFEAPMFELIARNMAAHLATLDRPGRSHLMSAASLAFGRLGTTTCVDAAADAIALRLLSEADAAGTLAVRVAAMPVETEARALGRSGIATGFGSDRLWLGAAKLFADGGMSSRTAAMDEPYRSPAGQDGMLLLSPDELARSVSELDAAGFQVGVHAQGERAIRATLDAFAQPGPRASGLRHRIEHGGAFRADLRGRAAELGTIVVSQPGFVSQLGDGFLEALGEERGRYLYPFRSLCDQGTVVAGSSDAPVIDASPLLGIRDAVLRLTDSGVSLAPEEAVSPAEALRMYTLGGAYSLAREATLGSLGVGKFADFIALADDPLAVPPERIADIEITLTVVGGRPIHGSLPRAADVVASPTTPRDTIERRGSRH